MALQPGTRLGPYEILELRGKGGMGEVYRARDTRLGRDVAVKILPSELSADSAFQRRFEREAKTISQLQHPNVCTLYDVGSEEGTEYLVMEFLEGETLEDRLARGVMPIEEVVRVASEIAAAIEAAHERGVVHRDLKPGNVMLTRRGTKVLDFGLAREASAIGEALDTRAATLPAITREGRVVGTMPYMAPEQLEGKPADERTDIWALGCLLYEMATGERPFHGESQASLIAAILQSQPEPAARLSLSPPHLRRVVRRCLEKESERRPQSARDVSSALERLARVPGRRVRLPWLPATWRRPAWIAAIPLAVLAASVVVWFLRGLDFGAPSSEQLFTLTIHPFENLTVASEHESLDERLASLLISDLSRLRDVRVVRLVPSGGERGNGAPPRVDAALEGELTEEDGRVVSNVRLTDARSGTVLLSERFEGGLEGASSLQRQIGDELTRLLSLSRSRLDHIRQTADGGRALAAYRFYSSGIRHLQLASFSPERRATVRAAVENLRQAVRIDPDFGEAQAELSTALQASYAYDPDPDLLRDAEVALQRAVKIDPGLPHIRGAELGLQQLKGDLTLSIEEIESLLERDPHPDDTYRRIAFFYSKTGDLEKARELLEAAVALADENWLNWFRLASIHLRAGELERARTGFSRAAELAPAEIIAPSARLLSVELSQGRFRKAIEAAAHIRPEEMDAELSSNLATAHFYLQDYDRAERYYRRAIDLDPNDPVLHRNLGDLFLRRGDPASALQEFLIARDVTDKYLRESPNDERYLTLRALYSAKAADCGDALDRARDLRQDWNPTGRRAHRLAQAFALCNAPEEALALLRQALDLGVSPQMVAIEDEFSLLREHPGFSALTQPATAE